MQSRSALTDDYSKTPTGIKIDSGDSDAEAPAVS